jgi:hypothetical protein
MKHCILFIAGTVIGFIVVYVAVLLAASFISMEWVSLFPTNELERFYVVLLLFFSSVFGAGSVVCWES